VVTLLFSSRIFESWNGSNGDGSCPDGFSSFRSLNDGVNGVYVSSQSFCNDDNSDSFPWSGFFDNDFHRSSFSFLLFFFDDGCSTRTSVSIQSFDNNNSSDSFPSSSSFDDGVSTSADDNLDNLDDGADCDAKNETSANNDSVDGSTLVVTLLLSSRMFEDINDDGVSSFNNTCRRCGGTYSGPFQPSDNPNVVAAAVVSHPGYSFRSNDSFDGGNDNESGVGVSAGASVDSDG